MGRRSLALAVLLILAGSACASGSSDATKATTTTSTASSPTAAPSTTVTIAATTTSTLALPPPTYQALGAFDWIGGRIDNDGYQLRLWVSGVGAIDPANPAPCTVVYFPTATESADEVRVSVTAQGPDDVEPGRDCPAVMGEQVLVIDLAEPVGTRKVFALGTYRDLVDGSQLTDLDDVVPAGWDIVRDSPTSPYATTLAPTEWSRTWAPPRPANPANTWCVPTAAPVTLIEGGMDLADRVPVAQQPATVETVQINGSDVGTVTTTLYPNSFDIRLIWSSAGRGYALVSSPWCVGDVPPDTDDLIATAQLISPD